MTHLDTFRIVVLRRGNELRTGEEKSLQQPFGSLSHPEADGRGYSPGSGNAVGRDWSGSRLALHTPGIVSALIV